MTTVSDGLYQYGGVPVGGMFTPGRAIFVRPGTGSDGDNGKSPNKAVKTLSKALSLATANVGDVVYLIAESNTASSTTDYQTATLDWNKDGVHLIGIGAGPIIGQRSRIGQDSSTLTIDSLFKISANNCLIKNIEIFQGVSGSTAITPVALEVTGQRNVFDNLQISGMGDGTAANDMDVAAGRSLKLTAASENIFKNCYIGLDTVIKATAEAECELSGACTRNIFDRCIFNTYTSNANMLMWKIDATMDRFTIFRDCAFINVLNITSATEMTAAFDAASINGNIHILNPYLSGFTNITAADAARVKVLGLDGTATGHLIGISAAVDVA
jgi:hypothetical protein